MPCRFASSGTVAPSRSASRAILALNAASNFLRDFVISVLHRLRQSRTLNTLTFGPISGVHFTGYRRLVQQFQLPSRCPISPSFVRASGALSTGTSGFGFQQPNTHSVAAALGPRSGDVG